MFYNVARTLHYIQSQTDVGFHIYVPEMIFKNVPYHSYNSSRGGEGDGGSTLVEWYPPGMIPFVYIYIPEKFFKKGLLPPIKHKKGGTTLAESYPPGRIPFVNEIVRFFQRPGKTWTGLL